MHCALLYHAMAACVLIFPAWLMRPVCIRRTLAANNSCKEMVNLSGMRSAPGSYNNLVIPPLGRATSNLPRILTPSHRLCPCTAGLMHSMSLCKTATADITEADDKSTQSSQIQQQSYYSAIKSLLLNGLIIALASKALDLRVSMTTLQTPIALDTGDSSRVREIMGDNDPFMVAGYEEDIFSHMRDLEVWSHPSSLFTGIRCADLPYRAR